MGTYATIMGQTWKSAGVHRNKTLALKKALRLKKKYPDIKYRITPAKKHPESRKEYKKGYVVWVY